MTIDFKFIKNLLNKISNVEIRYSAISIKYPKFMSLTDNVVKLTDDAMVFYYPDKKNKILRLAKTFFSETQHEIAHFVEMKDINRLLKPDFGFTPLAEDTRISGVLYNSDYHFHVRETKVRAIESRLYTDNYKRKINIAVVPQNFPLKRFQNQEEFLAWRDDLWERTYKAWSLDRIESEFIKRAEFVNNFLETKV